MRDLGVQCGQLVLKDVAGPIAVAQAGDTQAAAGEAVMDERTHPHDLGAGVVVIWVLHHLGRRLHRSAHWPAGAVVGYAHGGLAGEESLHVWAIMSVTPAAVW